MKYCTNCGAKLKDNAKFCTQCGHHIEDTFIRTEPTETYSAPDLDREVEHYVDESESSSSSFRKWLLLIVLICFGWVAYWYLFEKGPDYDPIIMLDEASGNYYDFTGLLTGEKNGLIEVEVSGGHLYGSSKAGRFTFDLVIKGYQEYFGTSNIDGVVTDHTVNYDGEKERLTFKRKNSPMDWYIEKRKRTIPDF